MSTDLSVGAVRFGPCNYCGKALVYLDDGWGVAGGSTAKNCQSSPDGWHQADRLSDGSFSIGSGVWPGVSKLVEEVGELSQVLGKLIATHGATDHWDGTDLRVRLIEEMGDVTAAINFVSHENLTVVERVALGERAAVKHRLFSEWQDEQSTVPS